MYDPTDPQFGVPLRSLASRRDPVSLGAGITAGAGLLGGALSARATRQATRTSRASQQEALQYERERDAEEKRRYDEQQEQLRQAWMQREQQRQELLNRYGRGSRYSTRGMPPGWTPGATGGGVTSLGRGVSVTPPMGISSTSEPLTPPLVPPRNPWGDWGV